MSEIDPIRLPRTPEQRALASAAQREAWQRDPDGRRRRVASGVVRAAARQFYDDDTFQPEIVAALELGRAEGAAAAKRARS